MKSTFTRLLIFTALFLFFNTVNAQIPNNGFENWEPDGFGNLNPSGWETLNDDPFICVEQYVPAKIGNYSMKVMVFDMGLSLMSGVAMADFPYTDRPSSLSAWIKCTVMPGDAVYLMLSMWKGDSLIASPDSCKFIIDSTISQYTHFSFPISYQSSHSPDSANITIIAGKSGTLALGTEIILDELTFGLSVGTEEYSRKEFHADPAYPNPACGRVNIPVTISQRASVEIDLFDQNGSKINTSRFGSLEPGRHDLEISTEILAVGLYTYRLTCEGNTHTGKFIIRR